MQMPVFCCILHSLPLISLTTHNPWVHIPSQMEEQAPQVDGEDNDTYLRPHLKIAMNCSAYDSHVWVVWVWRLHA